MLNAMQGKSSDKIFKVLSTDRLLYGPIDLEMLVQWVGEQRVQPETWIHSETLDSWITAGNMEELHSHFVALAEVDGEEQDSAAGQNVVTVEDLREFERFAPYSNEELTLLLSFCEVVVAAKGDVIIKKGDLSDSLFLILAGEVRARMLVGSSDNSLGMMHPGELFGEVAMLSQTARTADVVAEAPSRLLQLTSERFQQIIAEHPSLAAKMLFNLARLLATRMTQRNEQLQKDLTTPYAWH